MAYHGTTGRPSGIIDLKKLERESRGLLCLGFLVSVIVHALFGLYLTYGFRHAEIRPVDLNEQLPITIVFRTIPPKRDMPFTVDRHSSSRKVLAKRKTTAVPPLMSGKPVSGVHESPTAFLHEGVSGIEPGVHGYDPSAKAPFGSSDHTPGELGIGIGDGGIQRFDHRHIHMTDEMIDIDHLDTGEFKGLAIIDPQDKHNVKGYIHIPRAIIGSLYTPEGGTAIVIQNIRDFIVNAFSGVEMKIDPPVFLSSQNIHRYPFLYIPAVAGDRITGEEAENLRRYFDNGGFILIEPYNMCDITIDKKIGSVIRQIFPDHPLETIPWEHRIFHCYYDVYDMDSPTWEADKKNEIEFKGIFLDGRLVLVYTSGCREVFSAILDRSGADQPYTGGKDMTHPEYEAAEFLPQVASLGSIPPTRNDILVGNPKAYRICINSFVYALTRQGSIAQQFIEASTVTVQTPRDMWQIQYRSQWRHTERSDFNPDWNGE